MRPFGIAWRACRQRVCTCRNQSATFRTLLSPLAGGASIRQLLQAVDPVGVERHVPRDGGHGLKGSFIAPYGVLGAPIIRADRIVRLLALVSAGRLVAFCRKRCEDPHPPRTLPE